MIYIYSTISTKCANFPILQMLVNVCAMDFIIWWGPDYFHDFLEKIQRTLKISVLLHFIKLGCFLIPSMDVSLH